MTTTSLEQFLQDWDTQYRQQADTIPMFDRSKTFDWSPEQKKYFVRVFYHVRGHFYKFLWFLGSLATNDVAKRVALENIADEWGLVEVGKNLPSHEQLYYDFAEALGISRQTLVTEEALGARTYLAFVREFNDGHIARLLGDADFAYAAFSAYERLDNGDYARLLAFTAERLGVSGKGLVFFEVHTKVRHFESTRALLEDIWARRPDTVRAAFAFIAEHQLEVTRKMNDATEAYA